MATKKMYISPSTDQILNSLQNINVLLCDMKNRVQIQFATSYISVPDFIVKK